MTNRRKFIKQITNAGFAGSILPTDLLFNQNFPVKKDETLKIACWCDLGNYWSDNPALVGGEDKLKTQLDNAVKAGIDILIPMIQTHKYQTKVYYKSSIDGIDIDNRLTPLMKFANERKIEVHPMILTNCDLGISKEEYIRRSYQSGKADQDRKDRLGRPCASWKETREGVLDIIQDIIKYYPVSGIHLDAIRYMDTGRSLKWPCECEACQAEYKYLIGKDMLTAEDLKIPGILQKFLSFRCNNIKSVVEKARKTVNAAGLVLSLAARADYFETALVEGQDWILWAKEGLMDYICPMNYTTDREDHIKKLSLQMKLIGKTVPIYDGIGRKWSGGEITTAQMIQQAEDAIELGASGITIFHFDGMGENDFHELNAFKKANL